MGTQQYRIIKGSVQDRFRNSRAKYQIFGGGFGNGKTAAAVIKALQLSQDYPGSNGLIARATYPKLNDTIRKEFLKWCPPEWIKSFPLSKNSDNTCVMTNGSTINFRYIQQQGKGKGEGENTTSNLLSATYDWIIVDQMEDPEIVEKDFNDLIGRLRGNAIYVGDDPTMPRTGPRWFIITLNPTRNWVYRSLVKPILQYNETGYVSDKLLCKRYPRDHAKSGQPVLGTDGKPILSVELFEGSTYTNAHNLADDFIQSLEDRYQGQQRDRYLYGEWAAYEGLVYPQFNELVHVRSRDEIVRYLQELNAAHRSYEWVEGYDYGIAEPSVYLAAAIDDKHNVFILDGFYRSEFQIDNQARAIRTTRAKYAIPDQAIYADPAVFRRTVVGSSTIGETVARLFFGARPSITLRRGNNEKLAGITKFSSYLNIKPYHRNPFTGERGAPNLYVAAELTWWIDEITSYYWKQSTTGERIDDPIDRNDHAMDATKYLLTRLPDVTRQRKLPTMTAVMSWAEREITRGRAKAHRYG